VKLLEGAGQGLRVVDQARAGGVGEALFSAWYTERADERIALAFYDKTRFVTEGFVELVDRALARPGTVAAALAATRGQRFYEWQDQYKKIKQPALLLWGREDGVTLLSFGERLSKDLPHAKLVVYPQCGHFPMLEHESASTAELDAFLDAKPDAAASNPESSADVKAETTAPKSRERDDAKAKE